MNRGLVSLVVLLCCAGAGALLGLTVFSSMDLLYGFGGGTVGVMVAVLVLASMDSIRKLTGSSILLIAGLIVLFLGERMISAGTMRGVVSGLGVAVLLGSVGLRAVVMTRSEGRLREAHRIALWASLGVLGGLVVYALTLESVVTSLFDDDEGRTRWQGALGAIWPILVLAGTLPTAAIDRVIGLHPRMIPPRIVREASLQALSAALATALIFPVNYIASQNPWEKDVAYFRTTRAGSSTLGAVGTLSEPVKATLFYPAGSDVGRELKPYFATLADSSNGMLTVEQQDQALVPELAKELKIRDNGYVVFQAGESVEKFALPDDIDKAKSKLKKLDETVSKTLLKVAKGQQRGYFIVGHGEANHRERDNPIRKLNSFKKELEAQNMKFTNLGVSEGLENGVPADADLLILAAPQQPLSPNAFEAISTYLDEGGRIMVMADPGGDPMSELMDKLGIDLGTAPLAHATNHLRQTRGPADRILLATNRYGSHKAVKTLSKSGTTNPLIVPTVLSVEKREEAPGKLSTLVRTFPDTWPDIVRNGRREGEDEVGKVWDIALASEGPDQGGSSWRAVVIGDVNWASDPVFRHAQANQVFAVDVTRWMLGEEALIGETNNEEDVKIQHTRDEDWAWFYLTVIGFPLMVFGVGIVWVRRRRTA